MELLKKAGFHVEERNLTMKDLYVADEIFTCGTGEEINPIVMVDGRVIGDKKIGDITRKTIEMYIKFIDENSIPIY